MARQLLISTKDLKQLSQLSGNIDDDKLKQYVEIAQDTHLLNYLGSDLLARFEAGVTAGDLSGDETSLLNDYVKKMLVHWSLVEIYGFAAYTVSSKGIYKHTSENAETVSKDEVDTLIERHRNIAQSYTRRFIDYMCYNASTFPEYSSNTNEEVRPSKESDFGGWVL